MAAQIASALPERRTPRTLYVLEPCPACSGRGQHKKRLRIICMRCNASWPAAEAEAYLDGQWGGWWGWRLWLIGDLLWQTFATLPCGHFVSHVTWEQEVCQTCDGAGALLRPATPRETYAAVGASVLPRAHDTQAHRHHVPGVPTVPPLTTF